MNVRYLIYAGFIILMSGQIQAREIAGVTVPETVSLDGHQLTLNGAGIRSKFIFDIYVGALYLPSKTTNPDNAITSPGAKRVLMHFLYDEVEKQKLTDGWTDGFKNNLNDETFSTLKDQLDKFNQLFITVKKGNQISLDYLPDIGTRVIINGQLRGTITGDNFNQALLKVWLGNEPADENLKEGMLGQ